MLLGATGPRVREDNGLGFGGIGFDSPGAGPVLDPVEFLLEGGCGGGGGFVGCPDGGVIGEHPRLGGWRV